MYSFTENQTENDIVNHDDDVKCVCAHFVELSNPKLGD